MTVSFRSPQEIGQALQQAVALQQRGDLREAEKIYTRVLKAVPDQFDALNLLGTIKVQRGQAGEAFRLINAAIKINPRVPDAWVNRGIALHALKRSEEALASFDQALALNPADIGAVNQRANVLLGLGRHADALAAFDRVLAAMPRHPEARLSRGIALAALGRPEPALAEFDAVIGMSPGNPAAHYNRGIALFDLGRYAEAVAASERTLALAPDHVKALHNRGMALQALNRFQEALASYDAAIARQRDYADAHFNRSLALLTLGDLPSGFAAYEWRWQRTGMPNERRGHGRPLWLGEFPLQRKTILLQAEQGLGDTIQFARYVPPIARTGAKVILEVQRELVPLLVGMEGASSVVGRGEALPPFDVQSPLGSLPLALKTELSTIPAEIPYIKSDPARVAKWQSRLNERGGRGRRPRIGIAWAGNAKHGNDRNRSIALAELAPLFSLDKPFVAIQRDLRDDDASLLAAHRQVMPIGDALDDFADTAAVLDLVDLVITVDTSVAHLAGAMGRPVWILLPFSPDWRWTLIGESSRWYPTARLFRQPSPRDWASVVAQVRSELEKQ